MEKPEAPLEKQSPLANTPKLSQWDVCVGIIPLIAMSVMLVHEIAALCTRPQMAFVPITLLAVVGILAYNWRTAAETTLGGRRWTAIGIFILAVLAFLYSVWEFSPWLSHVALVLCFFAWTLGRFGNLHWGIVAGWSVLLASTLPLPWGWDLGILHWLQGISTWATACALDALGIACLQNGNQLEIRGLSLFAEEVCDGFGSLYAYLSFAMIILAFQNRGLAVSCAVLLLVPFWSVLANFVRLFAITTLHEYADLQLANGRDFLLLQVATVLMVLILIWLSSLLFRHMFEPIPVADAEFGPVFSGINKLLHWPMPDPLDSVAPEDPDDLKMFLKREKDREEKRRNQPAFDWRSSSLSLWLVRGAAGVLLVAAALPVAGMAGPGISGLRFTRPTIAPETIESVFNEASMPETLDGQWSRAGFSALLQSSRNPLGQYHLTWVYVEKQRQFVASINLPILGWQDPVARRVRSGWKADRIRLNWEDGWPWCEAELENELGGKAYLFYCLYTDSGQPFTNVPSSIEAVHVSQAPPEIELSETNAVTRLFQLFTETGQDLSEPELLEYRESFLTLRNTALRLGQSTP